jgi:hypothetical protein
MIFHWKTMLQADLRWRSFRGAYATPRRIVMDEQEDILVQRIRKVDVDRGLCYCDEDFRLDAFRFSEEIRQQLENEARVNSEAQCRLETRPLFKASGRFIQDFRQ